MNELLSLVLVCCPELLLATQPKLVGVKKLQTTLHIVEDSVVDVLQRFIQRE